MKGTILKPLIFISTVFLAVSLACGLGSSATQAPNTPTAAEAQVAARQPAPTAQPTEAPVEKPTQAPEKSGAVDTLDGVQSAVIQIEADGTFVDPEVGWQVNVGKMGSGFIIDRSGIAVTNNHVVTGAALLKVWVGGDQKKSYNAKVLGVSECSDLAVIKIAGNDFPYLEWYGSNIKVGLKVFAAGFPLGDPNYTLTDGIVSKSASAGETSWASVDSVIEHSAKINPGNSGGPLVNEQGQIIGINYATVSETDQNFAIGRDEALKVIDQLKGGKNVDSIGVNGGAVSGEVNGTPISGVWVRSVASGSPADKARIAAGDIIYQLEGQVLATDGTMSDYCDILRSRNATDTMGVTVIRFADMSLLEGQVNGRELEVKGVFASNGSSGSSGSQGDYTTVQDDTGTIQVDVPSEWTAVDGRVWKSDWGNLKFDAPSISATTNFDDYNNYHAPGVFFTASDRLAEIGGFVELLDGVTSWYENDCKKDKTLWRQDYGEGNYYDPYYEGKFDVWKDCKGTDTQVMVLAARPKANPTAYLILVEIRFSTQEDLDRLSHVLDTFEVIKDF
ncbi:MAG: trypsin-like peptidase domain-containing protein [Omnitrophica WOR_2 bacterium]